MKRFLPVPVMLTAILASCQQSPSPVPDASLKGKLQLEGGTTYLLTDSQPSVTLKAEYIAEDGTSLGWVPVTLSVSSPDNFSITGSSVTAKTFPLQATVKVQYKNLSTDVNLVTADVKNDITTYVTHNNQFVTATLIDTNNFKLAPDLSNLNQLQVAVNFATLPTSLKIGDYMLLDNSNFYGKVMDLQGNTATLRYAPIGEVFDAYVYRGEVSTSLNTQQLRAQAIADVECKPDAENGASYPEKLTESMKLGAKMEKFKIDAPYEFVITGPQKYVKMSFDTDLKGSVSPEIDFSDFAYEGKYKCGIDGPIPGLSIPSINIPGLGSVRLGASIGLEAELDAKVSAGSKLKFGTLDFTSKLTSGIDTQSVSPLHFNHAGDIDYSESGVLLPDITTKLSLAAGPNVSVGASLVVLNIPVIDIDALKIELKADASASISTLEFSPPPYKLQHDLKLEGKLSAESDLLKGILPWINKITEIKFPGGGELTDTGVEFKKTLIGYPSTEITSKSMKCENDQVNVKLKDSASLFGLGLGLNKVSRAELWKRPKAINPLEMKPFEKVGSLDNRSDGEYLFTVATSAGETEYYAAVFYGYAATPIKSELGSIKYDCKSFDADDLLAVSIDEPKASREVGLKIKNNLSKPLSLIIDPVNVPNITFPQLSITLPAAGTGILPVIFQCGEEKGFYQTKAQVRSLDGTVEEVTLSLNCTSQLEIGRTWDVLSKTGLIHIRVWDDQCEDGDIISLALGNFSTVVELTNAGKMFDVQLSAGSFPLIVTAVNGSGNKGNCSYINSNTYAIQVWGDGENQPSNYYVYDTPAQAGYKHTINIEIQP